MAKKTRSATMKTTTTTTTTSSSSLAALPAAASWFESELGERVAREKLVSSSSWATAYKYETESGKVFFVKTSLGRDDKMFRTEAAGLEALSRAAAASSSSGGDDSTPRLVVPRPLHAGPLPGGKGGSFIAMEHLNLGGGRGLSQEELGVALAKFHLALPPQETAPEAAEGKFGFGVDNFIGGTPQVKKRFFSTRRQRKLLLLSRSLTFPSSLSLPKNLKYTQQPNGWYDSWVDFYREKRLKHILSLIARPGSDIDRLGKILCANLELLFEDDVKGSGFEIKPALIHGDLWSGNIATVTDEETGKAAW